MVFSIEDNFKTKVEEIWNDAIGNDVAGFEKGYAILKQIEKSSILFVGINPSSSKNDQFERIFYENSQQGDVHPYFKKFQDISFKTNFKRWEHLDLLFIRETSQKKVKELFDSGADAHQLMIRQLDLSAKMIQYSNPSVIVVSNAFARELFKLKFETDFDNTIGTYRIINTSIANTPVFFTSMLTGQRALDLGSYERLIWHIGKVLDAISVS